MQLFVILIAFFLRRAWMPPSIYQGSSSLLDRTPVLNLIVRSKDPRLACGVVMAFILLIFYVLYQTNSGWLFGLLWLLSLAFLLAVIFGGLETEDDLNDHLPIWRAQSTSVLRQRLKHQYGLDCQEKDIRQLHFIYWEAWSLRWLQRIFTPLFWYAALGPLAVIFLLVARALTHQTVERITDNGQKAQDDTAVALKILLNFLQRLQLISAWIPARLMALSFLLTGNFFKLIDDISKGLFEWRLPEGELLANCAKEALGVQPWVESKLDQVKQGERQLHALRRLLNRTLFVWVGVIALFVLVVG